MVLVQNLAVAKGGVRQKWGRGPTSCSKRRQTNKGTKSKSGNKMKQKQTTKTKN